MESKEKIIKIMKEENKPLNAKKNAELTDLDRKIVDKIMLQLKNDGVIHSPKRCFWQIKC